MGANPNDHQEINRQQIADYKNINSKELNKLAKEGKILALIPKMKKPSTKVTKGITQDF